MRIDEINERSGIGGEHDFRKNLNYISTTFIIWQKNNYNKPI